jgi:hypothetical protein
VGFTLSLSLNSVEFVFIISAEDLMIEDVFIFFYAHLLESILIQLYFRFKKLLRLYLSYKCGEGCCCKVLLQNILFEMLHGIDDEVLVVAARPRYYVRKFLLIYGLVQMLYEWRNLFHINIVF